MKVRFYAQTNMCGSRVTRDAIFDDEDLEGLTEDELDAMLLEQYYGMGLVDFGWDILD